MTLAERLIRLAKMTQTTAPVVSVYLNTRWADEQRRERTRLFLKNEIRKARETASGNDLADALDWVSAQAEALTGQTQPPDVHGVALFASSATELREVVPVRGLLEDAFVVSSAPFLRPLAALLDKTPAALVVFVDAESARLIPVSLDGVGDEVRLDSAVPGHHRRGGWAQLAQSRYQRHIEARRERHFEAVGEALGRLVEEHEVERIVIAGSPDTVAAFRKTLSPPVSGLVAGTVPGSRHEPATALVARAAALIDRLGDLERGAAVGAVLTDAAKDNQAVAGLEGVLEAVRRGAVHRLYLLRAFRESGRACAGCGALQPGTASTCRLCGQPTTATELGEAMLSRAIAADGRVTLIDADADLARVGGVAARLRFPL